MIEDLELDCYINQQNFLAEKIQCLSKYMKLCFLEKADNDSQGINEVLNLVESNDNFIWQNIVNYHLMKIWKDHLGKHLLQQVVKLKIRFCLSKIDTSYADENIYLHPEQMNALSDKDLYPIMVIIHEIAHAIYNREREQENSLHEEIAATMLGYSIASRILQKRDLTEAEVMFFCKKNFKTLVKSTNHKSLKVEANFIKFMKKKYKVKFPHEHLYKNTFKLYLKLAESEKLDYTHKFVTEIEQKLNILKQFTF